MLSDKEELFDIKGDPKLPALGLEYDLSMGKIEVPIRYCDRITWADVYRMEIENYILVHMFCPKCEQCLKIENTRKRMRLNLGERRIDIERFRCTYPGCDWTVVVEGSIAKDA